MVPLAEFLTDPQRAKEVPLVAIPAILTQLAAVQVVLGARLLEAQGERSPAWEEAPAGHRDQWITPDKAAKIAGLSRRWFYQHKSLPFVRPISRKVIRVSEPGLRKWLQKRP
jgi:hypothetical protein